MDIDVIAKHWSIIADKYPDMNIGQMGMIVCLLGSLRASMGHEGVKGTITEYIHPSELTPDVRQCLDFLEREILCIKKSRIDIDYWKRGNEGSFRRDSDKVCKVNV